MMVENLNPISAQELFGEASKLALYESEAPLSGIATLGSMYQIATGAVSLLFIFIFIKYYNLFGYLLLSCIGIKEKRSSLHSFGAEIKNIEIFTSISGLLLLTLFVMRLVVMPELEAMVSPLGLNAWAIGGMVMGATLLLISCERGMIYLIGIICERERACKDIWHIKQLHFSTVIILLTPLLILALMTEGTATKIALSCSVAVCLIAVILFIKDTFLFFRAQRFSIFHWILYLCALEFFPLSLLLAPIARGGF